jgi:hypothetical protein
MQEETYERDGIEYEISLVPHNDMFQATWTCSACQQSGGLLTPCLTSSEAFGRAKAHAFTVHHVPVHALGRV